MLNRTIERLAFDTNAVIYLLEGVEPYNTWLHPLFVSVAAGDREAVVSVVSETEALVKPLRTQNRVLLGKMGRFFSGGVVQVIDVRREIAWEAANLRAGLGLKMVDALVAATAIILECDAIVGNDKEFQKIRTIPYVHLDDAVRKA